MLKKLSWQIFSNIDRNQVIEDVKNAISNSDRAVMNFNMYSDLALTLSVEIEENEIRDLHKTLSNFGSVSELEFHEINSASKKEWLLL